MNDFVIQINVTITDPKGGTITIPLPAIDPGAEVSSILSTVENLISPIMGVVKAL